MRAFRLQLWLTVFVPHLAGGQALRVDSSTLVARSLPNRPLIEPHLAIDPIRPGRILAAAFAQRDTRLAYPQGLDEPTCSTFHSVDSGQTWTRHDLDATKCFDPWVAIGPDGSALVTVVARHHGFPQQGDGGLLAYRSADGGASWDSVPLGLGRNHDHTTITVDLSQSPRRGWVYVSSHRGRSNDDGRYRYGLYLARSRNGGKTFDDPVWVIPNNLHNLAEMPVVLSDGTLGAAQVAACLHYEPDTVAVTGTLTRETFPLPRTMRVSTAAMPLRPASISSSRAPSAPSLHQIPPTTITVPFTTSVSCSSCSIQRGTRGSGPSSGSGSR